MHNLLTINIGRKLLSLGRNEMLKIECPKCGMNRKAELVEVCENRRYRFKCPLCNIFFDLAGEDEDKAKEDTDLNRRKHIRYSVRDDIIASLRNRRIRIGKVKDISVGGVSFEYTKPATDPTPDQELVKPTILLYGNEFSLPEIPCRVVYDVSIDTPTERLVPSKFVARRCGVQFTTLLEDQKMQLDLLVAKGVTP